MGAGLNRHEVIIIGAGQAGLALGHHLAHQRRRFTILDSGDAPAAVWRSRWVKDDAQHIADQISKLAAARVDAPTSRGRSTAAFGV